MARITMKKFIRIGLIAVVLAAAVSACGAGKEVAFRGQTMGTFYSVKVVAGYFQDVSKLQGKIESRLDEINRSMSTYIPDSEISRFNNWQSIDQPFPISADFLAVMQVAEKVYQFSQGAWDGTVDPLVTLWGFGRRSRGEAIPSADAIKAALDEVGLNRIRIDPRGFLTKRSPSVTLDLASIAKGYGVDALAELLRKAGFGNFLVEIGGEVYAAGVKKNGEPWRVGVNTPKKDAPPDQVYKVIPLTERALATSGDYRNFIEIDGKRYSHVIDPRTGYPVANGIVSVSVAAQNCTVADGLATALMVMGVEPGLALVNRLDDVAAMIVEMKPDGNLLPHYSTGHNFVDIK
jgi:thiamine biosynthesis lipoprotein